MTGTAVVKAYDTCGAKAKTGSPCRRPAGWGTQHAGEGKCKLHGGASPIRHGRYSTVKTEALRALIAEFEADPDPLDARPELAVARALLKDWIDRYEGFVDALHAWNDARLAEALAEDKKPPRPARVPEIQDMMPLLEGISKAVKRIEDIRSSSAISRADLARVMTEMGRVVATIVEPELAQEVKERWLEIRL